MEKLTEREKLAKEIRSFMPNMPLTGYSIKMADFILARERELLEGLPIKLAYLKMKRREYHRNGVPDEKEDLSTLRHFLVVAEIERRK